MVLHEKSKEEQDLKEPKESPAPPGRKQMWALWVAAITALGSTGIPKIVEMLENKPSVEQVQNIVAEQTKKLTDTVNTLVDAVKGISDDVGGLKNMVPHTRGVVDGLLGRLDLLQDVLRDCCTRRDVRERLDAPPEPSAMAMSVEEDAPEPDKLKDKKPIERLQKMPSFNVQKQLQLQQELK
jgi:hypothetical protein